MPAATDDVFRAVADPIRRERFLQMWTLKEAYAKARGLGLRIPVRNIETQHLSEEPFSLRLHKEPALPAQRQWHAYSLTWESRWSGSVLVDCSDVQQPELACHRVELAGDGFSIRPEKPRIGRGTVDHA